MTGHPVVVVGGGNEAGQAALHLAKYASHVTLLVRGRDVAASMSEYLVSPALDPQRRGAAPGRVTGAHAVDGRLSEIQVTGRDDGKATWSPCGSLFVLIGSSPHTGWLEGVVERDDSSFVLVGTDATAAGRSDAGPADAGPANPWRRRHPASSPSVTPAGDRSSGSRPRSVTEQPSSPPCTRTSRPGWSCDDRRIEGRAPSVPAIRWLLGFAALLVFLAGVQASTPSRSGTATHFAWTIASPMTAVFLGASYWSAVGLEFQAGRWRAGGPWPGLRCRRVRLHEPDVRRHAAAPGQVPPRRRAGDEGRRRPGRGSGCMPWCRSSWPWPGSSRPARSTAVPPAAGLYPGAADAGGARRRPRRGGGGAAHRAGTGGCRVAVGR